MYLKTIGNEGFLPYVVPQEVSCAFCASVFCVDTFSTSGAFREVVVAPTLAYDDETGAVSDWNMDSFFGIWKCGVCHVINETRLEPFNYDT